MSAEVNYGYAKSGLEVVEYAVHNGVTYDQQTRMIPGHEMPSVDPELSINKDSHARVSRALASMYRKGRTGFTLIKPNPDAPYQSPQLMFHAWGGYSNNPVAKNELVASARQFPGAHILIPDSPATGRSAALPRSVSKELAKTGSYKAYGELIQDDLGEVIDELSEEGLVVGGFSEGGRRALGYAAVMPNINRLNEISPIDPVGTHEQGFIDIVRGFSSIEAAHSAKYVEESRDYYARESQRYNDSPRGLAVAMAKIALRGGLVNQLIREPQAMAHAGIEDDLQLVVARREEESKRALSGDKEAGLGVMDVFVTIPTASALTDVDAARALVERVSRGHEQTNFVVRELPDQTHALRAGNPAVDAVLRDLMR